MKAVEMGIITRTTKSRLEEMEAVSKIGSDINGLTATYKVKPR